MRVQSVKYFGLLAGVLVLTGCEFDDWGAGVGVRRTQDFHFTQPLTAGGRLTVEGFNGSIEISGWDRDTVDISGTKHAPSDELLEALKIEVGGSAGEVTVRAIRPTSHRGNLGASFVIRVPRRCRLERIAGSNGAVRVWNVDGPARLRTSNGPLNVASLGGDLEGQTSNGPIEIDRVQGDAVLRTSNGPVHAKQVRGGIEATTSNGPIQVDVTAARAGKPVRLETSNGPVDLKLPAAPTDDIHIVTNNSGITLRVPSLSGRVSAQTSNSEVSSDFEVRKEGRNDKNHLEGVAGQAGPLVSLTTSNGRIRLMRD